MKDANVILTYKILDYIRIENELIDSEYVYYKFENCFIKIKETEQTKLNKMVHFIIDVLNCITSHNGNEYLYPDLESNIEYLNNDEYINYVDKFLVGMVPSHKVYLNNIDPNIKIRSIDDIINELDKAYPEILFGG